MLDKTAMSLADIELKLAKVDGDTTDITGHVNKSISDGKSLTKKLQPKSLKKGDWINQQKQSRDQLKNLSKQKKQLRLQTLYKTFNKDMIKN